MYLAFSGPVAVGAGIHGVAVGGGVVGVGSVGVAVGGVGIVVGANAVACAAGVGVALAAGLPYDRPLSLPSSPAWAQESLGRLDPVSRLR